MGRSHHLILCEVEEICWTSIVLSPFRWKHSKELFYDVVRLKVFSCSNHRRMVSEVSEMEHMENHVPYFNPQG